MPQRGFSRAIGLVRVGGAAHAPNMTEAVEVNNAIAAILKGDVYINAPSCWYRSACNSQCLWLGASSSVGYVGVRSDGLRIGSELTTPNKSHEYSF